jgi:hypothetical protein
LLAFLTKTPSSASGAKLVYETEKLVKKGREKISLDALSLCTVLGIEATAI